MTFSTASATANLGRASGSDSRHVRSAARQPDGSRPDGPAPCRTGSESSPSSRSWAASGPPSALPTDPTSTPPVEEACADRAELLAGDYQYLNNVWNQGTTTDYEQCVMRCVVDGEDQDGWRWRRPNGCTALHAGAHLPPQSPQSGIVEQPREIPVADARGAGGRTLGRRAGTGADPPLDSPTP